MTQEDKELLLRDLCARLPYGATGVVPVEMFNGNYDLIDGSAEYDTMNLKVRLEGINVDTGDIEVVNKDDRYSMYDLTNDYFTVEDFTPYLRPMSSMTEDEKLHVEVNYRFFYNDGVFENIDIFETGGYYDRDGNYNEIMTRRATLHVTMNDVLNLINWLNSHHFDYRGLIERGLAIEAPKGMYKTE